MHLIFATRGIKHNVDEWINELSTRYMPAKIMNKETGKVEDMILQLRVCPVELWDVSFQEENKDSVLNTILQGRDGKMISDRSFLNKYLPFIRKAMHLKPVPEYDKSRKLAMRPPEAIDIFGIGIREDKWITEDGRFVNKKDKTDNSFEGI